MGKLGSIIIKNGDVVGAVKNAVLNRAFAYGKTYELLHKQIWRKDKNRLLLWQCPLYTHHNGRPVAFVQRWNIKSQYSEPYSYRVKEGDDPARTFGLNQLFMGQNPKSWYQGNPKDGIYHDDCYIQPKAYKCLSGLREKWMFINDEFNFADAPTYEFYKHDEKGNVVVNSVVGAVSSKTEGNVTVKYATLSVATTSKGVLSYELGKVPTSWQNLSDAIIVNFINQQIVFTQTESQWSADMSVYEAELERKHGGISFVFNTENYTDPLIFAICGRGNTLLRDASQGKITVYMDGTVIEYVPFYLARNSDGETDFPAHYKVLPMIYLDTGDLAMSHREFIDNWNDYFELVVHEDSEWWQALVKPIAAIIVIVVSYFTAGAASAAASSAFGAVAGTVAGALVMVGGVLTAIGILGNNKNLMMIGGAMSALGGLIAGVGAFAASEAGNEASKQLAVKTAEEVFKEGSQFSTMFESYGSAVGLENLITMPTTTASFELLNTYTNTALQESLSSFIVAESASVFPLLDAYGLNTFGLQEMFSLGKDAFGLVNNLSNISSTPAQQSTTSSTTTETTKVAMLYEDTSLDPEQYIKNVIDIL